MVVRRVVTSRAGGASTGPYTSFNLSAGLGDEDTAVRSNQDRLAAKLGLSADRLVWMDQVHGNHVAVVAEPPGRPIMQTDAMVTATPNVALVVRVADCVPVLLADDRAGIAGVAHAGRPGAKAGIATSVVAAMVDLGSRPADIDVLLGPAICGGCYEVPPQMQSDVDADLPGSACTTRKGTSGLDLVRGLSRQLLDLGVARVVADPRCTAETPDLYSYRRDGVTGRQAGIAWVARDGR